MSNTIIMCDEMPSLPRTSQRANGSARELLALLAFIGNHQNIERALSAMKGDDCDSTAAATSEALADAKSDAGATKWTGRIKTNNEKT